MLENKRIEVLLFILGFILIGIGVYVWNKGVTSTIIEKVVEIPDDRSQIADKKTIYVDVAGEVEKPGVYSFVLGARVGEAIASAGGTTVSADEEWIEKNLNRAKTLSDGEKIYIPAKQESNNPMSQESSKININSASVSELDRLYGVGVATANKIIAGRPYANIEELKTKKIVTEKVYEQIKDMISTW